MPTLFTSTALAPCGKQGFIHTDEGRVEPGSVQLCWPASLVHPPCPQEGDPVLLRARPRSFNRPCSPAQRLETAGHLEAPSIQPLLWVPAPRFPPTPHPPPRGYYHGIAGTRFDIAASAHNFIIRTHNTTQSLTCFIPLPFPNCISVKAPEVISLA